MTPVFENDCIKVSAIINEGNYCVISFTGVGHALGGIDLQTEEFKKLSPGFGTQLFVVDKRRSWGNDINFQNLVEIIKPYTENKRVISLGNSMGGFLSILLTRFIKIERCISFSPQFSVSPKVMPTEDRWDNYVENIKLFRFESLSDCFSKETLYFLIFGDDTADRQHLVKFPVDINVYKLIAGNDHNVARFLLNKNLLYPFIERCISSDDPSHYLQSWSRKLSNALSG